MTPNRISYRCVGGNILEMCCYGYQAETEDDMSAKAAEYLFTHFQVILFFISFFFCFFKTSIFPFDIIHMTSNWIIFIV